MENNAKEIIFSLTSISALYHKVMSLIDLEEEEKSKGKWDMLKLKFSIILNPADYKGTSLYKRHFLHLY